jgi:tripartite-type tricarboxylate transporter receptor subunit TctC
MKNALRAAAAIAAVCVGCAGASAQSWPEKPVRMIVPFPPGGGTDYMGRLAAQFLSKSLGQQVFVENKGGAGGSAGLLALKQAAADGYTLATTSEGPIVNNPAIYPSLRYDPLKDFTYVALMTRNPVVLVVNPSVEARSIKDLVELAKTKSLAYSSGGIGNYGHLAGELLASMTGAKFAHTPYQGTGPATVALLSGEVQFMFSGVDTVIEHIRAGKMIPLGIGETKRLEVFPDVPTIAETVPGYESGIWLGVIAPAGTPQNVVDKLEAEITKSFKDPETVKMLSARGQIASPLSSKDFTAMVNREIERWHPVIKKAGIKAE